ncbi:HAMP domain-containing methyl-accepting chemotaxis protein [Brevibacillus sp. NRS-1366]|uniref:HAMP domain-containing methyl-accepting chemotaxis protein n=1 Tax=Brevibacillus sp. NRS-1366 TaxID=3233899 RepID=UPI003D1FA2DF
MTIRKKVVAGFILVLALLLVTSIVSVFQMSRMGEKINDINENWMPSVTILGGLNGETTDVPRLIARIGLESDQKEIDKLENDLNAILKSVEQKRKSYELLLSSDQEKQLYTDFSINWDSYTKMIPNVLSVAKGSDSSKTTKEIKAIFPKWQEAKDILNELIKMNEKGSNEVSSDSVSIYQSSFFMILIISILAIAIGIIITFMIFRDIKKVASEIQKSAETVAGSSEEMAVTIEQVATGNQQQAISVSGISDMMVQMSSAINEVAVNVEQTSEFVNKTVEVSSNGGQVMLEAIEGMREITGKTNEMYANSKKIHNIIGTIQEIANQTNLLALNASIEAARAGEHGRGFAVVANEVGKLAKQSGDATKEITALISSMQSSTVETVETVSNGNDLISKAQNAFDEITRLIKESSTKVAEVAASCEEQNAQVLDIVDATQNIAAITQESSASAEETASSVQELAGMAENLNHLVLKF